MRDEHILAALSNRIVFSFFFFFQGFAPEITIIGGGGERGWRGKMEKSNARDDEFVTIFTA